MRTVDPILYSKLDELTTQTIDVSLWEIFYEFVILCYSFPSEKRFGVSDLYFELKKRGIAEAAEMIKIYAHGMYILAKYNNLKIYGDDFNV